MKSERKDGRPRAVMLSKRANVFYLERCRVLQKDERVVYLTDSGQDIERYFNIPDKNTLFLMLGTGTSISSSAIRKLSESNVIVGFCGSGGSPLTAAVDQTFVLPQDEYRPTHYAQAWFAMWQEDSQRLTLGKRLLAVRVQWTLKGWQANGDSPPNRLVESFSSQYEKANTSTDLLLAEARWAKQLYGFMADCYDVSFVREPGQKGLESSGGRINRLIDHGNYLAYGYAAAVLHGLGIPFSLPVLHGKTRRGGLVFDVADLIKDAHILPLAFEMCRKPSKGLEKEFRSAVIERIREHNVVDQLFEKIEELCEREI